MCCSSATALVECAFSRSQGVELESERTLPTKHTEKGGGKERDGWPAMVVGKTLQSVVKLTGWVFFPFYFFGPAADHRSQ